MHASILEEDAINITNTLLNLKNCKIIKFKVVSANGFISRKWNVKRLNERRDKEDLFLCSSCNQLFDCQTTIIRHTLRHIKCKENDNFQKLNNRMKRRIGPYTKKNKKQCSIYV